MINKDKFGNTIYPNVFKVILMKGNILLKEGFLESYKNPNLFYKKVDEGLLFMDFRGTAEIPIWEDTDPLFYYKFNDDVPLWKRRRVLKNFFNCFINNNVSFRLSFEFGVGSKEFENCDVWIDKEEGVFDFEDGFCRFCLKDFQEEGEFCSKECEEDYLLEIGKTCKVCNKQIKFGEEISHHVSYFPEKMVFVHKSYHNFIHKSDKYPNLKSDKDEINKFYKK